MVSSWGMAILAKLFYSRATPSHYSGLIAFLNTEGAGVFIEGWTKDSVLHQCLSRVTVQHTLLPLHAILAKVSRLGCLEGGMRWVFFFCFVELHLFVCLLHVSVCTQATVWRSKGHMWEWVLSSYQVGPGS
jgi:hypothetical protein